MNGSSRVHTWIVEMLEARVYRCSLDRILAFRRRTDASWVVE